MLKVQFRRILIVEDDENLRRRLAEHFSVYNFVTEAGTLAAAREATDKCRFDIILLDVVLPDGSGLQLLDGADGAPVVILSDLGEDGNLLEGFSAGAADYIVKPASEEIIEARMALRLLPESSARLTARGLTLDTAKRTAEYKGKPLDLTSSEFNILCYLMQNAGKFRTAAEIYEDVWKMPHLNTTTIKVHLSNLRKKMLSLSADCADLILTDFGRGYAFAKDGGDE